MARHKQVQVPLVSVDGTTQPAFPGGWVLAIFEALRIFTPDLAAKHGLPISRSTRVRIKRGEAFKQSTYDEIEAKLGEVIATLFPRVARVNGFAAKYVAEYFRLWNSAAGIAPRWVEALGFEPEMTGVLARALLRDLVLRLCYLESCERALRGVVFDAGELTLLCHDAPAQVYTAIIREHKHEHGISMEKLAEKVGLNDEKNLYRLQGGKELPGQKTLRKLSGRKTRDRLLAGIGFFDALNREVALSQSAVCAESFRTAEAFLVHHLRTSLAKKSATKGDGLLLHPGFDELWREMPDALWRAHLYTLQFARFGDLAQAYLQFAAPDNDRALIRFLDAAEREPGGSPHQWMNKLKDQNKVVPFPKASISAGE